MLKIKLKYHFENKVKMVTLNLTFLKNESNYKFYLIFLYKMPCVDELVKLYFITDFSNKNNNFSISTLFNMVLHFSLIFDILPQCSFV